MSAPKAIVLRTAGTNCDAETLQALRLAGAEADLVHVNRLLQREVSLDRYRILVIPGGFSYGDDIAAGKILANELIHQLGDTLRDFVEQGRLVIGICNGFQVLVKAGLLPGLNGGTPQATLTFNDSGKFQCQWVQLKRENSACRWLHRTDLHWELPIAHGEGKVVVQDNQILRQLEKNRQVVFRYVGANPNGSVNRIAGICNKEGNVIGLMPHPERHVTRYQHPEWTRQALPPIPSPSPRDPVFLEARPSSLRALEGWRGEGPPRNNLLLTWAGPVRGGRGRGGGEEGVGLQFFKAAVAHAKGAV